jgi:hypothetical protein
MPEKFGVRVIHRCALSTGKHGISFQRVDTGPTISSIFGMLPGNGKLSMSIRKCYDIHTVRVKKYETLLSLHANVELHGQQNIKFSFHSFYDIAGGTVLLLITYFVS